jgi:hypothetical protein
MPDGSIVLTGGWDSSGNVYKNDTWRSTDNGATWTLVNASSGWIPRFAHGTLAIPDGSILLFGGGRNDGSVVKNDVWRSTDSGLTWAQVNAGADWPARYGFGSVVLPDSSIVMMGGSNFGGYFNDVWRFQSAGSSVQNPLHMYTVPGVYSVALQVYNAQGYNSMRKTEYIHVIPETPPTPDFILNLKPGWNFISVPTTLKTGSDTALIFRNVDTDGHSVWGFDASARRWFAYTSTTPVKVLDGFWIYSRTMDTVPLLFNRDPLQTPPVKVCYKGWNAIGFSDTVPVSARNTLLSLGDTWTQVIGFDAGNQVYETSIIQGTSGIHSDTKPMLPMNGYWLYTLDTGELAAISA